MRADPIRESTRNGVADAGAGADKSLRFFLATSSHRVPYLPLLLAAEIFEHPAFSQVYQEHQQIHL